MFDDKLLIRCRNKFCLFIIYNFSVGFHCKWNCIISYNFYTNNANKQAKESKILQNQYSIQKVVFAFLKSLLNFDFHC